jgi:hypothetical protein
MGLLLAPSLVSVAGQENKNKHCVSFNYDWTTDAIKSVNIGGLFFQGSSYVFDVSSLQAPANLPALKSMQICAEFNAIESQVDGELVIVTSGIGQVIRLGALPQISTTGRSIITAVLPIVTNSPTKITFAKQANSLTAMCGNMQVSLFDFNISPYISTNYSA